MRSLLAATLALWLNQAAAQTPSPPPPQAAPCYGTPAECHLAAGKALLATNPHAAVDELYASYTADKRTATLALYGVALRLDHRYSAAAATLRRARTRFVAELEALQRQLADAKASNDASTVSTTTTAISALQNQIQNVDTQLTGLESETAHVRLKFAGAADIVVAHKNEGDVADPFSDTILVNADEDTLIVTYPDGKTIEIPVKVPGGSEQTIVIPVQDGQVVETRPKVETPPPITQQPPRAVSSRGHTRRWIGVGAITAGAASLTAALVFQLQANNRWDDAQMAGCMDDACERGSRGAVLAQESEDRAHLALGASVIGVAFVAAGVTLVVLDRRGSDSPSTMAFQIVPQLDGAAASLAGRF